MAAALPCPTRTFTHEPLTEVLAWIHACLAEGAKVVELRVPDPDRGVGLYAGERIAGTDHVHRPFRAWVDLAERMRLRLHTPQPESGGMVRLRLSVLDPGARWEPAAGTEPTEKYGADSGYQRIDKREDPGFVLDLADALDRVLLPEAPCVLDLGVNTGDELALLVALRPELSRATFVGVDHSASALAVARQRFDEPRHRFIEADLADLADLPGPPLPRFDLVLCLGTLHSPGVDDRALIRHLVQERLTKEGSVVLGFPNCSYLDGEVLHGATMKNFTQPDLSLLVKSVTACRRYLHKHRRKVFVTGKHTVLVTGVPEAAKTSGRAQP